VLVHRIEIDRALAVIVGDRLAVVHLPFVEHVVVVVERIEPDRGDAERLEIRKPQADAGQVAAVIR
jgi:hypothetical protein